MEQGANNEKKGKHRLYKGNAEEKRNVKKENNEIRKPKRKQSRERRRAMKRRKQIHNIDAMDAHTHKQE